MQRCGTGCRIQLAGELPRGCCERLDAGVVAIAQCHTAEAHKCERLRLLIAHRPGHLKRDLVSVPRLGLSAGTESEKSVAVECERPRARWLRIADVKRGSKQPSPACNVAGDKPEPPDVRRQLGRCLLFPVLSQESRRVHERFLLRRQTLNPGWRVRAMELRLACTLEKTFRLVPIGDAHSGGSYFSPVPVLMRTTSSSPVR